MNWHERRGWVFDLDGTLILAMHDFDQVKRRLGLAVDRPLLEGIEAAPAGERAALWAEVRRWEASLAAQARPAPDAVALLEALASRSASLGVLTRNTRDTALATLAAAGLDRFFHADDVLGRTCAAPKPAPDGVHRLLARWQLPPSAAVMLGDDVTDVLTGQAAGTATVWLDRVGERRSPGVADRDVARLDELLSA